MKLSLLPRTRRIRANRNVRTASGNRNGSPRVFSRTVSVLVFLAAAAAVLEVLVRGGAVPAYLLPAPSSVVEAAVSRFPEIIPHLSLTVQAVIYGFGLAFATAFTVAVLMHHIRFVRSLLYPLIVLSQTIPLIVLAPLFILWFGFGLLPKVLIVTLVCFFPLTVNTLEGLDSVDRDTIDLLRTMGAGRIEILLLTKIPASLGHIFSGLKVAATYSVIGAVIGEWLGGTEGLGVYMVRAQKAFAIERVFAAVIYITLISLVFLGLVMVIQRAVTPWKRVESQG
jgi:ABC-type nitrate/sulfonate/bicarbonate transport system permease component